MNIGLAVHNFDPASGTGGYVVELARRLARRHDVTVYAAWWPGPLEGARMVRVPALRGSAYATLLTFPAAFAAVRSRHDIVHTQGWLGRGDVVTAHIVLSAWRHAAAAARVASPPGERLLGGFVAAREGAAVRSARAVIAPSRRAADDIARWYGRSAGVAVIHHGFPALPALPDRAAARRTLGLPADGFVAAYVGDARKGFAGAARALARVAGVRLLVASESPRAPYLEQARGLGVADRVHWAGVLPAVQALAAADVLLHPTIYDTFAMVVAEALAVGVPVIVSREAGIVDLLAHRESAWIAGTDEDLAAALTTLRDDPTARRRLGEAGRVVAAARTWDHACAETEALYERCRGG